METKNFEKSKKAKKPAPNMESNIETNFSLIIQHTLEEVLEEVQSQIKNVSIDFKTSLRGIEKEMENLPLKRKNQSLFQQVLIY
ncbi:MAG: hypothetical protein ACTSQ9_03365 [Candidatus Hodarchaeales archaeon]